MYQCLFFFFLGKAPENSVTDINRCSQINQAIKYALQEVNLSIIPQVKPHCLLLWAAVYDSPVMCGYRHSRSAPLGSLNRIFSLVWQKVSRSFYD